MAVVLNGPNIGRGGDLVIEDIGDGRAAHLFTTAGWHDFYPAWALNFVETMLVGAGGGGGSGGTDGNGGGGGSGRRVAHLNGPILRWTTLLAPPHRVYVGGPGLGAPDGDTHASSGGDTLLVDTYEDITFRAEGGARGGTGDSGTTTNADLAQARFRETVAYTTARPYRGRGAIEVGADGGGSGGGGGGEETTLGLGSYGGSGHDGVEDNWLTTYLSAYYDPTFETSLGTEWVGSAGVGVTRTSAQAHSGTYSALAIAPDYNPEAYHMVGGSASHTTGPGELFEAGVWVRPTTTGVKVALWPGEGFNPPLADLPAGVWTHLRFVMRAHATLGHTYPPVVYFQAPAGEGVYTDDVYLGPPRQSTHNGGPSVAANDVGGGGGGSDTAGLDDGTGGEGTEIEAWLATALGYDIVAPGGGGSSFTGSHGLSDGGLARAPGGDGGTTGEDGLAPGAGGGGGRTGGGGDGAPGLAVIVYTPPDSEPGWIETYAPDVFRLTIGDRGILGSTPLYGGGVDVDITVEANIVNASPGGDTSGTIDVDITVDGGLIDSTPSNDMTGTIDVDITVEANIVNLVGMTGTIDVPITVQMASQLTGDILVGIEVAGMLDAGWPAPVAPTPPTSPVEGSSGVPAEVGVITPPMVRRVSPVWPAPTLVEGRPQ